MYTAVLGVVENYPHRYKDFIAVLQQNTRLYSELLEILNESSSIVSALSGTPTLDELCSLPIENVWYPLGLWLGVEEKLLQWFKQWHLRQPHVEMFKAFLKDIKNTHEYEQKASKSYGQLVRALVKVGKKKVAEEICTKKGISFKQICLKACSINIHYKGIIIVLEFIIECKLQNSFLLQIHNACRLIVRV